MRSIVLVAVGLFAISAEAQEQAYQQPPEFFKHPVGQKDPYEGRCRRFDNADCCGRKHCYPVPSDDLGRLQLPDGTWIDPLTMSPTPTICESSLLPPGYNWLDHVCDTGSNIPRIPKISCVFIKGQSS